MCTPKILEFFWSTLGFTPGSKTYTVRVPKIIRESDNPQVWASFVRGYFDCDGNLHFMKRPTSYGFPKGYLHTYPRVKVACVSRQMIIDVSELLTKLEIKHTIHSRQPRNRRHHRIWRIVIRGNTRLKHWMQTIGFSNSAKLTRYQIFREFGYVPPNTSIHERRQIINRERCPLEYYMAP